MSFDPKRIHNIADLREAARAILPRGLFEFVDRGTENERALQRNRAAIDRLAFLPRVLVDVAARTCATTFFGQTSKLPLAIAPTGAAGLLWLDGEVAIARAAARAGVPFTLSTASIISMERVAAEAGGNLWFQLYMWPQRSMSLQLVERARAAGYNTLLVTVDSAVSPNREYNKKNGFSLPMRISRANAWDVATHPRWLCNVFLRYLLRSGIPMLENYPEEMRHKLTEDARAHRGLPRNDSLRWDDFRDLRKRWTGPLLVKGILHPDDAVLAADNGADGIVISNHGGRNLDGASAPLAVLPEIVDRVARRITVMVDSGFDRGSDIVKALALGAHGAFIGRAPLWGVAAGGEAGAVRALEIFSDEIDRVFALIGVCNVSELTRSLLVDELAPLYGLPTRTHTPLRSSSATSPRLVQPTDESSHSSSDQEARHG